MAHKIRDAMPPNLDIPGGWSVVWAAVDPTTGAAVAGVNVSNASLTVDYITASGSDQNTPPQPLPLALTLEELNAA